MHTKTEIKFFPYHRTITNGKSKKTRQGHYKTKTKNKNMNHDSAKQNRIKCNTLIKQIRIELRILLVDLTR